MILIRRPTPAVAAILAVIGLLLLFAIAPANAGAQTTRPAYKCIPVAILKEGKPCPTVTDTVAIHDSVTVYRRDTLTVHDTVQKIAATLPVTVHHRRSRSCWSRVSWCWGGAVIGAAALTAAGIALDHVLNKDERVLGRSCSSSSSSSSANGASASASASCNGAGSSSSSGAVVPLLRWFVF